MNGKNAAHSVSGCVKGAMGCLNVVHVLCLFFSFSIPHNVFHIVFSFFMLGGLSIWAISPEERNNHDQKFDTLSPSMGYISGSTVHTSARRLLMTSLHRSVVREMRVFSFSVL